MDRREVVYVKCTKSRSTKHEVKFHKSGRKIYKNLNGDFLKAYKRCIVLCSRFSKNVAFYERDATGIMAYGCDSTTVIINRLMAGGDTLDRLMMQTYPEAKLPTLSSQRRARDACRWNRLSLFIQNIESSCSSSPTGGDIATPPREEGTIVCGIPLARDPQRDDFYRCCCCCCCYRAPPANMSSYWWCRDADIIHQLGVSVWSASDYSCWRESERERGAEEEEEERERKGGRQNHETEKVECVCVCVCGGGGEVR